MTTLSCEWRELKMRQFLQLTLHKHFWGNPSCRCQSPKIREKKEKRKMGKAVYETSWSPPCEKRKEKT